MKKILVTTVALTVLASSAFAQTFKVWDEVLTETATKSAAANSSVGFAGVRNRMHFGYDSEKFSALTRVGVRLGDTTQTEDDGLGTKTPVDAAWQFESLKANIWIRPLSVLEFSAGTDLDNGFTGHYMIARDQNMDGETGTWSDKSLALAIKPIEGLMIGLGLPLPISEDFKVKSLIDLTDILGVQAGVSYDMAGLFGVGVRYEGTYGLTAETYMNTIGGIVSFTGVENLGLALGFNSHLLSGAGIGNTKYALHNLDIAAS